MPVDHNGKNISEKIAVLAVYVLGFFCFLSPPIVHLAQLLLLLTVVMDWRRSIQVFSTLYGKVFLVFVPLALLSASWASLKFGYTDSQFEQALDYIHMALFWIAGWVVFRYQINLGRLFVVVIAGMLLSLLIHFPFSDYQQILNGSSRLRLGTVHPIQLGTYLAAISSGILIWLVSLGFSKEQSLRQWLGVGLLFIVLCIFLSGLILTWSRGPWLGFLAAMLFFGIFKLIKLLKHKQVQRTRMIVSVGIGSVIVVAMVLGSLQSENLLRKISHDYRVVEQVLSGDLENIPKTSLGWRVHMNVFAWHRFQERPWFGWGPYLKQLIVNSDLGSPWGHLHNSYWEVLLRFGIAGGLLFAIGLVWLWRGVWLHSRAHPEEESIMLALYGAFVVLMLWALIDYKFTGWENTAFLWLLGGAAASRAFAIDMQSD
jgi:O-antigen ligase